MSLPFIFLRTKFFIADPKRVAQFELRAEVGSTLFDFYYICSYFSTKKVSPVKAELYKKVWTEAIKMLAVTDIISQIPPNFSRTSEIVVTSRVIVVNLLPA